MEAISHSRAEGCIQLLHNIVLRVLYDIELEVWEWSSDRVLGAISRALMLNLGSQAQTSHPQHVPGYGVERRRNVVKILSSTVKVIMIPPM